MVSQDVIFWEVDTQADFMLPGGKLYVPGAEKTIPNLKRLVDAARQGRVLLVSDACQHTPDDLEFRDFPPHCVRGTPGAEIIPEGRADRLLTIPNDANFALPADFGKYQQVVLEKQTLDVFDNPQTKILVERLNREAEFVVFGVVTEYCVRLATLGLLDRGRRVSVVSDAIETLNAEAGQRTLEEFSARGARLITTDQALALLEDAPAGRTAAGSKH
jgi:nicotinamidase/pyrazinamidase